MSEACLGVMIWRVGGRGRLLRLVRCGSRVGRGLVIRSVLFHYPVRDGLEALAVESQMPPVDKASCPDEVRTSQIQENRSYIEYMSPLRTIYL